MNNTGEKSPGLEFYDNTVDIWKTAFGGENGIKPSDFAQAFKNSGKDMVNKFEGLIANGGKQTDNINILEGTKTCIGEDFSTLYAGEMSTFSQNIEGENYTFLKPKTPYDSELKSNACTRSTPMSYTMLDDRSKVVYEMALLTKKCVSLYEDGNDALNKSVANEFSEKAAKYKQYCDDVGVDWSSVLTDVSCEFQAESCVYRDEKDKKNMLLANASHQFLVDTIGRDFEDSLYYQAELNGMTLEDTLVVDEEKIVAQMDNSTIFERASENASDKWMLGKPIAYVGTFLKEGWTGFKGLASDGFFAALDVSANLWTKMRNSINSFANNIPTTVESTLDIDLSSMTADPEAEDKSNKYGDLADAELPVVDATIQDYSPDYD